MGWTSVRKLREVVANVRAVLAVEIVCAAQATRPPAPTSPRRAPASGAVHAAGAHAGPDDGRRPRGRGPARGGRRAADRARRRRRGGDRCAWPDPAGSPEPLAWFGGRLATGLVDVTSDPAALDGAGWWAVVADFEGELTCARFADVRPAAAARRAVAGPATARPGRRRWIARRLRQRGRARPHARSRPARSTRSTSAGSSPRRARPDADVVGSGRCAGERQPRAVRRGRCGSRPPACRWSPPRRSCSCAATVTWSSPGRSRAPAGPQADLLAKDHAENVMIVDLVRNDLGRVAVTGSVEVPALCAVEEHPGLVHLVSTVRGQLRPDVGWAELLAATFPPGSVTGAPKSSALRLIGELEPVPRGPYCGAVGWVDADRRDGVPRRRHPHLLARGPARCASAPARASPGAPTRQQEWDETELKAARLVALGIEMRRTVRADLGQRHGRRRRPRRGCRRSTTGSPWGTASSRRPRWSAGVPFALTRHLRAARRVRAGARAAEARPGPGPRTRSTRSLAENDVDRPAAAADHLHRRHRARSAPTAATARPRWWSRSRRCATGRRPSAVATVPWTRNERSATRRAQDHVVRRERGGARARPRQRRRRGAVRQHRGQPLRGHRLQRLPRAGRSRSSRRRCRRAAWRGSPGRCCWSGPTWSSATSPMARAEPGRRGLHHLVDARRARRARGRRAHSRRCARPGDAQGGSGVRRAVGRRRRPVSGRRVSSAA